ncbi:MAG: class I SAM-dependent methyltransferase [Hyphomicrobiales bacterium]
MDLSLDQIKTIKSKIDHGYRDMDIAQTIEYFRKFFVETCPIPSDQLKDVTIGDFGCGYGWLALAFALHTDAQIIAMDIDEGRVNAARELADYFGVSDKIEFRTGSLMELPFKELEVDVGYTIEALEHIGADERAFSELTRVCNRYLVATTPNKWFPLIAHDTRLPFCHWLPMPLRDIYAKLCGQMEKQHGNYFWSELDLKRGLAGFERAPSFMQFPDAASYLGQYPTYLPYNGGEVRQIGRLKRIYMTWASRVLGRHVSYALPNLSGIWQRRQSER